MKRVLSILMALTALLLAVPAGFASEVQESAWYLPDLSVISLIADPIETSVTEATGLLELDVSFRVCYDPAVMHVDPDEGLQSGFSLDVWVIDADTGNLILMNGVIGHSVWNSPVDLEHTEMCFRDTIRLKLEDVEGKRLFVQAALTLDGGEDDPTYTAWRVTCPSISVGFRPVRMNPGTRSIRPGTLYPRICRPCSTPARSGF